MKKPALHALPNRMESAPGPEVVLNGKRFLYFGGTSYLGLHAHPQVLRSAANALKKFGVHPATSRARVGNVPPVLQVEQLAAQFWETEDALYFVSGYVGCHI